MDTYKTADMDRQLDFAYEAMEKGQTEKAIELLKAIALSPVDPKDQEGKSVQCTAQFTLGELYWNGRGVAKDDGLAIHWYELAGENGHPFAQFWLGNAYCTGQRAEQNHQKAMYWYEKAAQNNVAWAQYHFGIYLTVGERANLEKALYWLQKAADSGVINAQIYLVRAFRQGLGTPPDPERADVLEQEVLERRKDELEKDPAVALPIVNEMLPGGCFHTDIEKASRLLQSPALLQNAEAQMLLCDICSKLRPDAAEKALTVQRLQAMQAGNAHVRSYLRLLALRDA